MALIITARNISDLAPISDYEVRVGITTSETTTKLIAEGTIKGHRRDDGWQALVRRIADELA